MSREKILIVADGPTKEWLACALREKEFDVITAEDGYSGVDLLCEDRPSLVISDLAMHRLGGLYFLQSIKDNHPNLPVIILTAGEHLSRVQEAMGDGDYSYIAKPAEMCRLDHLIAEALKTDGHPSADGIDTSRLIVGKSAGIVEARKRIGVISRARANVLVHGERGSGKRLAARVIHDSSPTKGHPFIGVDVPALPHQHLEEVLFGDVKEPQPAGRRGRKGLFEIAGAGTIVLNGISELPMDLQEELLGIIRKKEFTPVGTSEVLPLKARIIATTDKLLPAFVRVSRFREDLFFRLTESCIWMPPLRERKEDIPALVVHFLRKLNKTLRRRVQRIPGEVIELLQAEDWPGNVAELEAVLTQAVIGTEGEVLQTEYLVPNEVGTKPQFQRAREIGLDRVNREHIKSILDQTNWDIKQAAKLLSVSRQTLYNKIRKYGIVPF